MFVKRENLGKVYVKYGDSISVREFINVYGDIKDVVLDSPDNLSDSQLKTRISEGLKSHIS